MANLPPLTACLFAEHIRAELNGKSTIIGFYGIAPLVAIKLRQFPSAIPLAAMLVCDRSVEVGDFGIELEMIGPDGTATLTRQAIPGFFAGSKLSAVTTCVINFSAVPLPAEGTYALNVWSQGRLHSTTTFECQLGKFDDQGLVLPS